MRLRSRRTPAYTADHVYLVTALAGEDVGLREDTQIEESWHVRFANLALGYVDPGSDHLTPLPLSIPTRLASGAA